MWIAVTSRFRKFYGNLAFTDSQITEGSKHQVGVRSALNSNYYNANLVLENSFLTGSWGKLTWTRPPRDIDIYFELPAETYNRFEQYSGNKQSQLLQEIRGVLQKTYPNTEIRGDGPVVVVGFNNMSVEVVPAFLLTTGQYWICDTKDGGRYMYADPKSEILEISNIHTACNNNLRPMIMMLKTWQAHCNVPLKSFYLELLATEFLSTYYYRFQCFYYYDWFYRDFFEFLKMKVNGYIIVPGTFEAIYLGESWKSKAERAYSVALNACYYEKEDMVVHAGEEWQKIFGNMILVDPRD